MPAYFQPAPAPQQASQPSTGQQPVYGSLPPGQMYTPLAQQPTPPVVQNFEEFVKTVMRLGGEGTAQTAPQGFLSLMPWLSAMLRMRQVPGAPGTLTGEPRFSAPGWFVRPVEPGAFPVTQGLAPQTPWTVLGYER